MFSLDSQSSADCPNSFWRVLKINIRMVIPIKGWSSGTSTQLITRVLIVCYKQVMWTKFKKILLSNTTTFVISKFIVVDNAIRQLQPYYGFEIKMVTPFVLQISEMAKCRFAFIRRWIPNEKFPGCHWQKGSAEYTWSMLWF